MKDKKYLMVDDCVLDKVLDKIKEIISIETIDDTKILIDTDEMTNDIALKIFVILITCVIKDDKFYPKLFLEGALFPK